MIQQLNRLIFPFSSKSMGSDQTAVPIDQRDSVDRNLPPKPARLMFASIRAMPRRTKYLVSCAHRDCPHSLKIAFVFTIIQNPNDAPRKICHRDLERFLIGYPQTRPAKTVPGSSSVLQTTFGTQKAERIGTIIIMLRSVAHWGADAGSECASLSKAIWADAISVCRGDKGISLSFASKTAA